MSKYRIYAKILGYILPSSTTKIDDCIISKMTIAEQKRRKFKPLKGYLPNLIRLYEKSYLVYPRGADFRILKSKYVIYTDVDTDVVELDLNGALGVAINRFDKVIGSLAITASWWFFKKYNRDILYKNYDYQVCKIYNIVNDEEQPVKEPPPISACIRMPNWPEPTLFSELDNNFLNRISKCKDKVFKKSFYYLIEGSKSLNRNDPEEKWFLDFFKSIELIIKCFKGKYFRNKLNKAVKKLILSQKDKEEIEKAYKIRCDLDFAHASASLWVESLPPQYPVPSQRPMHPWIYMDCLAVNVLIKYFCYIDGIIEIRLSNDPDDTIDELCEVNLGEYYLFRTNEKNRKKLVLFLKKKISRFLKIKSKLIKIRSFSQNKIFFKIDYLKK